MTSLPLVYIISRENLLSSGLATLLTSKGCRVIFVTSKNSLKEIPNYVFLIDGIGGIFFSKPQINAFLDFINKYTPKTQVILPYVVDNETRQRVNFLVEGSRKTSNRNLQIIFLGQIYEETPYLTAIKDGRMIPVPPFDIDIYLISRKQAADTLVKGIFSYGFSKKEVVIAYKTSVYKFLNKIREINPQSFFETDNKLKQIETIPNFEFIKIKKDEDSLKEVLFWAIRQSKNVIKVPTIPRFEIKLPRVKIKFKLHNLKLLGTFVLVGAWVFMMPFISLFMASLTLKLGFNKIYLSDFSGAKFFFNLSEKFSSFSNVTFFFSSSGKNVSQVVYDFDISGSKIVDTITLGEKLYGEITGSKAYDLASESERLYLDMDYIYQKLSFLIPDTKNTMVANFIPQTDLTKIVFYLGNGKEIVRNLPKILGQGGQTNYLVLMQDATELRPTGGKINSFGILSFQDGRLISKTFTDVKEADGQLRGEVDPPLALQKYLGIKQWSLANSNWDSDFPTTASKAEWFLEKELGQPTDGVIAITKTNLDFSEKILNDLDMKNVQIFMNDENIQNSLNNLNWDGSANIHRCDSDNCTLDFLGVVEANLGENQVNPFIQRTANLNVNLAGSLINDKLVLSYTNTSTNLPYRNYIRVLTTKDSTFYKVSELINGKTEYLTPDVDSTDGRTEAGVLVQIPATKSGQVIFYWSENTPVKTDSNLDVYLRKQPGVDNMQTTVVINGTKSYNTNLDADLNIK